MNEFDKDSEYKINTEESVVFLYIKNERLDKETIITYHHIKKNKIPRNKPTEGDKRPVCRKE